MSSRPKLFGTDGIRGRANHFPITPEIALRAGRAVAQTLSAKKVIIGRDTRVSGIMLESAITAGLLSSGCEVIHAGVVPTPAIARLTQTESCDAGIMLTASHNPYQDNGIKIFGPDGYKLNDDLEADVERIILDPSSSTEPSDQLGQLNTSTTAAQQYIDYALTSFQELNLKGTKIILDCAHGAASEAGPKIFSSLGAELITIGNAPDGLNINEKVGALYPQQVAELVKEHQAHLGICFDGDADRVIFVDEKGRTLSGDRILGLCAIALKQEGKLANDTLVATVMSNLGLSDALKEHGISVAATGVGDRQVIENMRKHSHSLGGENSGHIIFSDLATTGDGIMSALKVLSIIKSSGQPLSQLADFMNEFPQELHAIPVGSKPPINTVPELQSAIQTSQQSLGETGRVLVRYSGTENKIRVLVEAKDAEQAKSHAAALCTVAQNSLS